MLQAKRIAKTRLKFAQLIFKIKYPAFGKWAGIRIDPLKNRLEVREKIF